MPKRLSSFLEIVQKLFDRFGNWNQICQASVWYLKHMPILVPVPLSVAWANFAWFDFKILTCRTQSAPRIHFKLWSNNVAGWIAAAKAVTVQGTVVHEEAEFWKRHVLYHEIPSGEYRFSAQTGLSAAGNVKRTFDVKANLCNTPCRSHPTSKQTRKSTKQTKSHSERGFGFGLCLSQWNQHAGGNNFFVSLRPPCRPPSISKIFWELAFIAQSTNVENHKDVLIGKINSSQPVWAISIQTTKQFSLLREEGLVQKIVIKPQDD